MLLQQELNSQNGSILLRNVSLSSMGRYACEVSADKTFETAIASQDLLVSAASPPRKSILNFKSSSDIHFLLTLLPQNASYSRRGISAITSWLLC